jgi:hypothetical protein
MEDVIDALGGRPAVLKLTGKRYNNLVNWLDTQKKFPARLYLIMTRALHERGFEASPLLWGIEPDET